VGTSCDPVGPYRSRDALERLLAHVLESKVELPHGIFLHPRRDAHATRCCQHFQSSSNIHSIAEYVAVLDNDVAMLMPMRNSTRLSAGVVALRLTMPACTSFAQRSVHHTAELDQQTITRRLDQPAIVRGDRRINQLGPNGLQT
jgi:hypothetical protein